MEAAVKGKRPLEKWALQGAAVEEALAAEMGEAMLPRMTAALAVLRALLEPMVAQVLAITPSVGEAVLVVAVAVCLYLVKILMFMVVAAAGVFFRALEVLVAPVHQQHETDMRGVLPTLLALPLPTI